ncbi:MAG: hypothetical protein IPJ01_10340 [Micavibrio sp.]|nr:hypothetical protein [Micavibrio sp.]
MAKIIKVEDKAGFCTRTAKHLSDFLNTKISFSEVLDELSLYEWGMSPKNKVLSYYVIETLKGVTVYSHPEKADIIPNKQVKIAKSTKKHKTS